MSRKKISLFVTIFTMAASIAAFQNCSKVYKLVGLKSSSDNPPLGPVLKNKWEQVQTKGAPMNGFMGFWNGKKFVGASHYSAGVTYDPAANTWGTTAAGPLSNQLHAPAQIWTGSKLIVSGGGILQSGLQSSDLTPKPTRTTYKYPSTGASYDSLTDQWKPIASSSAVLSPRVESASANVNGKMYVFGGVRYGAKSSRPTYTNDGAVYDPETDTWQALNMTGVPISNRARAMGSSAGDNFVVWGGVHAVSAKVPVEYYDDGAIYDIKTNTWKYIPKTPLLPPGSTPIIIWTGAKLVFFSTFDISNGSFVNHGAILDPATMTWSAMNLSGAPTPVQFHSYAWTGDKLIVFGGETSAAGHINTGAIYDPATDKWTATSMEGAPPAVAGMGLWTGDSMLFFTNVENAPTTIWKFK